MFPLLGSVVYFFAIYLPEIRYSRGARQVARAANQLINPGRELRQAREQLAHAPTLQNRVHLATMLLESGQAQEARPLFEQAASSPLGDEPHILTGLAQARLESGAPQLAVEAMEGLFARRPEMRRKPQPALLYAEALAAAGAPDARAAFEHAVECGNEPAARCRYADWLVSQADATDREQARSLYAGIIEDARHWTRFARDHNAAWLERAKAAMK
ncbi:hypothetical protein [Stenotrophomonas sp.]|uniref:hypothetical protein n=1 Tax=Stenotrophomonas sp. TaxID=69392 RepID=UPI00289E7355|nr:hypothetical protein [Stenotrophomonas sp.]